MYSDIHHIHTSYIYIICLQSVQNEAMGSSTGSHLMSSLDHLHNETLMLPVQDHSELLSAQHLIYCIDPENVCHNITTRNMPPTKDNAQGYAHSCCQQVSWQPRKYQSSQWLTTTYQRQKHRSQWTTLSQLRSGHCRPLNSYKSRLEDTVDSSCQDCRTDPQDVNPSSVRHIPRSDTCRPVEEGGRDIP